MRIGKFFTLIMLLPLLSTAQNVGINQSNPSQPLEVGGTIFTNSGGIMFPDSTLQTTAAGVSGPSDAVEDKSFGVLVFVDPNSIPGPFDPEGPDSEAFKVYDMEFSIERTNVGGVSTTSFGLLRLTVDIGEGLPTLYSFLTNGFLIPEFKVDLYDENEEVYYRLTNSGALQNIRLRLLHKGEGQYAHIAELEFAVQQVEWGWNFSLLGEPTETHCFNISNPSGGCG